MEEKSIALLVGETEDKNKLIEQLQEKLTKERDERREELIEQLQEKLTKEKDERREDRFIGIVMLILLFNIVFFTVMPSFGGPLAILILELLILIPLAKRMGMEQVATMIDRVLSRIASGAGDGD